MGLRLASMCRFIPSGCDAKAHGVVLEEYRAETRPNFLYLQPPVHPDFRRIP